MENEYIYNVTHTPVLKVMFHDEVERQNGAHSVKAEPLTELVAEHEKHRAGICSKVRQKATIGIAFFRPSFVVVA